MKLIIEARPEELAAFVNKLQCQTEDEILKALMDGGFTVTNAELPIKN